MEEPHDIFVVLNESVANQVDLTPREDRAPFVGTWVTDGLESRLDLHPDGTFGLEDEWMSGGGSWEVKDERLWMSGSFAVSLEMRSIALDGSEVLDEPADAPSAIHDLLHGGEPPRISIGSDHLVLGEGTLAVRLHRPPAPDHEDPDRFVGHWMSHDGRSTLILDRHGSFWTIDDWVELHGTWKSDGQLVRFDQVVRGHAANWSDRSTREGPTPLSIAFGLSELPSIEWAHRELRVSAGDTTITLVRVHRG